MTNTMQRFEKQYTNRTVLITIDGRNLFDRHFSLMNETYNKNTYLMFDWFTFPLTPRYVNYLSRECDCDANDPAAFFRWLSANKALYIAAPYRFDLLKRYLKAVHRFDVNFDSAVEINSSDLVKSSQTQINEIRVVHAGSN